jgi:hypothetical protein
MAMPMVDLPEPLSPTSPTVSPARTLTDTPSTARTTATGRRSRPPPWAKCTRMSRAAITSGALSGKGSGAPCGSESISMRV